MPVSTPGALLRSVPSQIAKTLWQRHVNRAWSAMTSGPVSSPPVDDERAIEYEPPLNSQKYDVAIVGAGIMGSCTAYELAKSKGLKVLLLEQYDFLHRRGSSHGESRIIRKTYVQSHFTEMMTHSYRLWAEAQREAQTTVYTRTGGLDWGRSDSEALQSLLSACRLHGVPHEVLSPADVSVRFPGLMMPADYIAVYSPDAGVLNATKSCAMFQRLAAERGAVLRDRTTVTDIRVEGDLVRLDTTKGEVTADKVVLCAGPWSLKMLQRLRVDLQGLLTPIHTTVAYWPCADVAQYGAGRFPVFISYTEGDEGPDGLPLSSCYGLPVLEYPGLLKVCIHLPKELHRLVPDPDTRSTDPDLAAITRYVAPFLRKHFKGVGDTPTLLDTCMYTMTPTEDFILDFLPGSGSRVAIAAGFSGHGFKLAPLVGKIMADLATKGAVTEPKVDMEPFKLARLLSPGNAARL